MISYDHAEAIRVIIERERRRMNIGPPGEVDRRDPDQPEPVILDPETEQSGEEN